VPKLATKTVSSHSKALHNTNTHDVPAPPRMLPRAFMLLLMASHAQAHDDVPCPVPAFYDPTVVYPVHTPGRDILLHPSANYYKAMGYGDNYYNYCQHMVKRECNGFCGAYRHSCHVECEKYEFPAQQCTSKVDFIPASVAPYVQIDICGSLDNALAECQRECTRRNCSAYFYQEKNDKMGCGFSPLGGAQVCGFYMDANARNVKLAMNSRDLVLPNSRVCYPVVHGRYMALS